MPPDCLQISSCLPARRLLKLLQYLLKDGEESASASMAQSKYFSIGNGISALSVGRPEA